jgi:hypothetical protein
MLGLASSPQAAVASTSAPWTAEGATMRRSSAIVGVLLALILGMALLLRANTEHLPSPTALRRRLAPHQSLSSLPLAARGVVSATLGADNPAYRITASGDGFQAQSPAQRLRMRFGDTGVQIGSGKTQADLSLRAIGYGSALQPIGSVNPSASANRVTYRHAGLTEWYRNGPLGLEQGFMISKAPSEHPTGALTLQMALSGNVHASPAAGGQGITLSRSGGPSLRYGGLTATDAGGRALHSRLALYRGRIVLSVDTIGAHYPLRIDPFVQQGAKLTPQAGEDPTGQADFADSVAVSRDGSTALIGAPHADGNDGAVWVFARSGSTWTQQGPKLTGGAEQQGPNVTFGVSVALSGDGDTALIGALGDNGYVGAAWVFTRSGQTWTQQGPKLTAATGEQTGDEFARSVTLSEDGNTALVGDPGDNREVGAAWVFTRSGSVWTQDGPKITAGSGEENGQGTFGYSVALSGDASTALIGAPAENDFSGSAWAFMRSGSTWVQQGSKLAGGTELGYSGFGLSVALSEDGNTALVGAPYANGSTGVVQVFTRSSATWKQDATLTATAGGSGYRSFGQSLALSDDGATALVGAPLENGNAGAAWVFTNSNSTWTQQGSAITPAPEEESGTGQFATSVALSGDATTMLIGDPGDEEYAGAAWAFAYVPPGPAPTVKKISPAKGPAAGGTSVTVTGTGFTGATAVDFGSSSAQSFTVNSATSITATSPAETTGTVDVTVTTPNGTSAISTKDHFTFEAPTITSVSPNSGSKAGGTAVAVTGTGFGLGSTPTTFKFSKGIAIEVECTSTTTCTMLSPAAAKVETADVTATVDKKTSAKDPPADEFAYH